MKWSISIWLFMLSSFSHAGELIPLENPFPRPPVLPTSDQMFNAQGLLEELFVASAWSDFVRSGTLRLNCSKFAISEQSCGEQSGQSHSLSCSAQEKTTLGVSSLECNVDRVEYLDFALWQGLVNYLDFQAEGSCGCFHIRYYPSSLDFSQPRCSDYLHVESISCDDLIQGGTPLPIEKL